MKYRPVVLIVLDGYGENKGFEGNAILQANKPNMDMYKQNYPFCLLQASGMSVGIPWGQPGNSEVGHLCMGAGRIIYQSLPRINVSIQNGSFFENPAFLDAIQHTQTNNSTLHLMGLVSFGSVHSNFEHLQALIELAKTKGITKLYIHAFTDGRDAGINDAVNVLQKLDGFLETGNVGTLATIGGRFYGMDRNNHWERIEKAYNCMTKGLGEQASSFKKVLSNYYEHNLTDEYVPPTILDKEGIIKDNDAVIFFNFREDRAREITKAFVIDDFQGFERTKLKNLHFSTMVQYEENLPTQAAFPPLEVRMTLAETIEKAGLTQSHIAETEKYAHVTYFFNGGNEASWSNEKWHLVPSSGTERYNENPEMKAAEVTNVIVQAIQSKEYDFIVANFANPDMIGHTGDMEATKYAVEFIDTQLGVIVKEVLNANGCLIITADHGNAEEMLELETGQIDTDHSSFPIPCFIISNDFKYSQNNLRHFQMNQQPSGILADIAPTVLELMNVKKPEEMTGISLLKTLGINK